MESGGFPSPITRHQIISSAGSPTPKFMSPPQTGGGASRQNPKLATWGQANRLYNSQVAGDDNHGVAASSVKGWTLSSQLSSPNAAGRTKRTRIDVPPHTHVQPKPATFENFKPNFPNHMNDVSSRFVDKIYSKHGPRGNDSIGKSVFDHTKQTAKEKEFGDMSQIILNEQ